MKTKQKNKILKKKWEIIETKKLIDNLSFSKKLKDKIKDSTYNDKNFLCIFRLKQIIDMHGGSGVFGDTVIFEHLDKDKLTVNQKINSKSALKKFLDPEELSLPDLCSYNETPLWPLANRIMWETFREGGSDDHPKGKQKYYF